MLDVEHDLAAVDAVGAEMADAALYDRLVLGVGAVHAAVAGEFRQAVGDDRQHVAAVALEIRMPCGLGPN